MCAQVRQGRGGGGPLVPCLGDQMAERDWVGRGGEAGVGMRLGVKALPCPG